jgi:Peptidase family M20/M25/M40
MVRSSPTCGGVSPFRVRARNPNAPRPCEPTSTTRSFLRLRRLGSQAACLTTGSGCAAIARGRAHRESEVHHGAGLRPRRHVRGLDDLWRKGLSPWSTVVEGQRIYGRGTADNKGQHAINIGAIAAVLKERGRLGFNLKFLIEMSEEYGSVGLRELCEQHKDGASRPTCSSPPTARASRPTVRPSFSVRAAAISST